MPFSCLCTACSGQVKSLNPKLTRANVLPPHDDDRALVVLQSEATHPSPTLRLRSTAACEVYHVALTERIHALIHTREGGRERGTCGNCQKRRRPSSPLGQRPRPRPPSQLCAPRIVAAGENVFLSVLGQRRSECSSYLALRRVASLAVKMNANVQPPSFDGCGRQGIYQIDKFHKRARVGEISDCLVSCVPPHPVV